MKKQFLLLLYIALQSVGVANAQKVLLPFGQTSKQSWAAKCFYAPNNGAKPADNWFAKDFDESGWDSFEGPVSTARGIAFFSTPWKESYSTYWVRRHFTLDINDIKENPFVSLYLHHDDGCEIYLNGWNIYRDDRYYTNVVKVSMTEEMLSHFVDGDNVIAIKVSDTGGEAFMDFGLEAHNVPTVNNHNFDSGTNGWIWKGEGSTYGGQNFNYLARFLTSKPFDVHQTINVPQAGLFKIRVQSFEDNNNDDPTLAWNNYNRVPVYSYIYAGEKKHEVKNVFDEAVTDNIYRSNEFFKTSEGTFVPTYMTSVSIAFDKGMYENEFYAYIDTPIFDFGVAQIEQSNTNLWVCFDNFRIEYVGEKALATIIAEMESVATLPMDGVCNSKLTTLLAKIKTTNNYEAKSRLVADYSDDFVNARKSSEQYAMIKDAVNALQQRLDIGKYMSEATVKEAKNLISTTLSRYSENKITVAESNNLLRELNGLNKRLNYTYIDVAVNVPGSLGDSILSKVENFVDVQSIKLSGILNDSDISTIQNRLSQLREIDMVDVKMTILPNKLFYQHSLLENVKLPDMLTTIGEYAFYQCYGLTDITFPKSLITINRYGFAECDNLQRVVLPEGLMSLGEYAFYSCDYNMSLQLPSTLKVISSNAFNYNLNLRNIVFSEGLTHIESSAFFGCKCLNNIDFPKSLYYIGSNAFTNNRSLSDISFNEGLYQIGDNAFYDCDALTEVILPSSLVLCNASPFDYCDNLKKVTCLSIEPPYMTDQIPYGLGMEGRELYVPALSINVYKQTTGWDKFLTIKPIDYLPENFTVLSDLHLTLPETMPSNYKPNVSIIHDQKGTSYLQYGSLTVNGAGTLSMNSFNLVWDPNYQYVQSNRTQNYNSLVNNSHLRSDNVSINLFTRNDRWTFVSFPFNVKVSEIETISDGTTNWVIRKYDGQKRASGETNETWVRLTANDILEAGVGYIIQGSRYIDNSWQEYSGFRMKSVNDAKKNLIFNSENAKVTLNEYESEFAHNRSWNLVGNPYPCYYDTRFMEFDAPITVWNINNNTYTAYSPSDDSYILCPGEAFFVQRPVDNGNIDFAKEGRQTNRNVRTLEPLAKAKTFLQSISNRIIANIIVSDGENTDRTRVVLNECASLDYEMDKDATKFMSSDNSVPQIFTSMNGINYAINERPISEGVVPLNLRVGKDGLYSISLSEAVDDCTVSLEDMIEGKTIVLNADTEYTFSAKSGVCNDRFLLHFSDRVTGIDEIMSNTKGNMSIYSIQGIEVLTPSQRGVYIQGGKKIMINK